MIKGKISKSSGSLETSFHYGVALVRTTCLALHPKLETSERLDEDAKHLLRTSIKETGFVAAFPLLVIKAPRSTPENPRYWVVDGRERLRFLKDERPDISEVPCRVLNASLQDVLPLLVEVSKAQLAAKRATLAEELISALNEAHKASGGTSTKIARAAKIKIALKTGYKTNNLKSLDRALKLLRQIYEHSSVPNHSHAPCDLKSTLYLESKLIPALEDFLHGGSPHRFERALRELNNTRNKSNGKQDSSEQTKRKKGRRSSSVSISMYPKPTPEEAVVLQNLADLRSSIENGEYGNDLEVLIGKLDKTFSDVVVLAARRRGIHYPSVKSSRLKSPQATLSFTT